MLMPVIVIVLAFRPVSPHIISGKIVDNSGNPIAAVNVTVKGTTILSLSAQDGTYKITATDKNASLVFSVVGFAEQEVKIKGRTTINITMKRR
jgi:hypothetical protein